MQGLYLSGVGLSCEKSVLRIFWVECKDLKEITHLVFALFGVQCNNLEFAVALCRWVLSFVVFCVIGFYRLSFECNIFVFAKPCAMSYPDRFTYFHRSLLACSVVYS